MKLFNNLCGYIEKNNINSHHEICNDAAGQRCRKPSDTDFNERFFADGSGPFNEPHAGYPPPRSLVKWIPALRPE